jgi:hypothetical protein
MDNLRLESSAREPQLLFVDSPDLASAVIAAVGADAVRGLGLVALGTLAEADGAQGVVRPALGRSRLGMSSFWIRHDEVPVPASIGPA